ncbi:hypothetical protein K435DRAFT_784503 [Dendrothele bispora CBS 962.96]|uniref:DUF6534 domain-containing protein n=1 Tax=Dendrothele bispora (strain CBS 962.96) TaxID=1314807 RepID=A0A4S8L2W6_DENBC|nr:hypothetical protein K435DRAFT_784503 [Dendrothele bispora CBS 962.96]
MSSVDVPKTFGALLIGALFASVLSGAVGVQGIIYRKLYPADPRNLKLLVFLIWFLDTFHTVLIWGSLWHFFIDFYGSPEKIDQIPWTLALSIILTAILTFSVHCFFAHRIYKLSKKNVFLTIPILFLAVLRLVSAAGTTAEMLILESFTDFRTRVRWLFTLGLALSSVVDVLITGSLFHLLRSSRTEGGQLNSVIDSLILYTFETGSITSAATIISMICWIAAPTNLVFMGLHFVISKLYANSLLVTLNTRKNLRSRNRSMSGSSGQNPALILEARRGFGTQNVVSPVDSAFQVKTTELQINVERSVQYTTDYLYDERRA